MEVSRKLFDGAKVTIDGSLGVITTLEFFQHHFSKMGHSDLLVTQNLSHPTSNQCSAHLTRSVRRRAASFKLDYRNEPQRREKSRRPSAFRPATCCAF